METTAILLAGGKSERISVNDKTTMLINNKMIFEYSLKQFQNNKHITNITIVCSDQNKYLIESVKENYNKINNIILGGENRLISVFNGFADSIKTEITLIHDAARPLINERLITESIKYAKKYKSGIPIINQHDSMYIGDENKINNRLNRVEIIGSQTPQSYDTKLLNKILNNSEILNSKSSYNDLPELLLANNITPYTFIGEKYNIKITIDKDLEIINKIIN
jgi:2-C-methyl-D-erythritol 4-phosphate cytidylyltransferase